MMSFDLIGVMARKYKRAARTEHSIAVQMVCAPSWRERIPMNSSTRFDLAYRACVNDIVAD